MADIRISIRNTQDAGGVFLTPVWFGLHDGAFDLFDAGASASAGLEAMAEDGNAAGLAAALTAADADGQGFVVTGAAGPIAAGETAVRTVSVDAASNGFASFAAMILPSNDAFVGTEDALRLFGRFGQFRGEQTVELAGADVFDAGTELNTERDAAFINQAAPNTGVTEGGVVRAHPGFNGSLGNPGGEGDQIILGGTNALGLAIDPVAADFTRPGATIATVHINTVVTRTGSDGDDIILGRRDDDLIDTGAGDDIIRSGGGWDVVEGGAGDDWIHTGRGFDVIVFATGDGHDSLRDFSGDDTLALSLAGVDGFDDVLAHAVQSRRGVLLDFDDQGSLFLRGVDLEDLSAAQFQFG